MKLYVVAVAITGVFLSGRLHAETWNLPDPAQMAHPDAQAPVWALPDSYPDGEAFLRRAAVIRAGLVPHDLGRYRRGYFSGGDPGKYVPGYAMARLLEDPDDADARRYMNDDRSYKEHYHFAAVNWGRFLPAFGEALTEETRQRVADTAARYGAYLNPAGTENHKTMSMTTANVLPWYTGRGLSNRSKEDTLKQAKEMLHEYVRGLYQAGQGEWDSSTYLMFDVNGFLNMYDFSPDPEVRLLAAAGLDWYMAAYALKYTDGVYCAPNQRGFAAGPAQSIADQTGWLWWGSRADITPDDTEGFRYAMHAHTSAWRPNAVLTRIARRETELLPVEQRNSKPNYWYGRNLPWQAGQYRETVYVAPEFTMGSLWNGHGSQITRFQLVVSSQAGGLVFSAGHPRKSDHTGKRIGIGYRDGTGRYLQSMQHGSTYLCLAVSSEAEEHAYTYFTFPEGLTPQAGDGVWWAMKAGEAYVGVGGQPGAGELAVVDAGRNREMTVLKFPGVVSALAVHAQPVGAFESLEAFQVYLQQMEFSCDMPADGEPAVSLSLPDGERMDLAFRPSEDERHGNRMAACRINGEPVLEEDWPIYSGPLVTQVPGMLQVWDGRQGYAVDFRGEMPVYMEYRGPQNR